MRRLLDRPWPVQLILLGIMFALVLPTLLISTVLLLRFAVSERAHSQTEVLAASERAADALDRELSAMGAALRALSTSQQLRLGDYAQFDEQARELSGSLGQEVVLFDLSGRQLVNTRLPFGAPLPSNSLEGPIQRAIETRAEVVSDLFEGVAAHHQIVALFLPVLRNGDVTAVLAISLEPAYISELLRRQSLPAGWLSSVLDGKQRVLARTQDSERYLGRVASSTVIQHIIDGDTIWTAPSLDGIPVLTAIKQLRMAAWRVSANVPISLVDGPLRTSLAALALGGALTLTLGGVLAWRLARSVQAPLQQLALASQAVGTDQPVAAVRTSIAEVAAVADALGRSAAGLRARTRALAAERARLATIIETVPVGLVIADPHTGRIVGGNAQLLTLLGLPDGPLPQAGITCLDGSGEPVPPGQDPLGRALAGAQRAELQCQIRRADGTLLWVNSVAAPVHEGDGSLAAIVVALLDIDETVHARQAGLRFAESLEQQVAIRTNELAGSNQQLRDEIAARGKAEEQLRQSQKMEAVGRLTGGIAHDFNNMLTVIVGSLDLLRRRTVDGRTVRLLDNALEGASRAATLTSRLLAFSRQQPLAPQALDVNRLVAGMSDLLLRTLGETVRVETALAPGLWPAHADSNQLENALLNLAVNARDAMLETETGGGSLVIETGNTYVDEAYAAEYEMASGRYVVVSVTDTGSGMTDEVLGRVFEPFYTTKPVGQGTGLGLSQVHGFAKQSGGHVAIATEPGRGTTVTLYLPRDQAGTTAEPAQRAAPTQDTAGRGETVLVVEDEPGVRRFTTEALGELGYVVLQAESAGRALALLDAHPETSLLFTDVVLPEVNGRVLADEARRRRPGLRVLFTTGYTTGAIVHGGQLDADVDLIGKPFTVSVLAAKIQEVLGKRLAADAADRWPGSAPTSVRD